MAATGQIVVSEGPPGASGPAKPARRLAGAAFLAVLTVALLVGCSVPSNTPNNYDDATEAEFMQGCTGADFQGTSFAQGATQAYCQCAYDWISSTYPYSKGTAQPGYAGITFSDLNNELGSNPSAVPTEVSEGLAANCNSQGSLNVSPATTAPPTTTTPPQG